MTPSQPSTYQRENPSNMILSTHEHYLDCLKPFANDSSIKLTAPASLFDKLAEIAVSKNTHRLDICRHALAEYIHNHEKEGR